MNMNDIMLFAQTIVITIALLVVAWQIYKLRVTIQAASCQDIVQKFFDIVQKPEFRQTFTFGPDWEKAPEEQKKKTVLCSVVFSFLEQLYVEASGGQLADRLSGPWVDFVKSWLNQDEMKRYWGSPEMICPKSGFDEGFQQFVERTHRG